MAVKLNPFLKLESKSSKLSKDIQVLIIVPFVIFGLILVLENSIYSLLLIPTYLLLIIIRKNILTLPTTNYIDVTRNFSKRRVSEDNIIDVRIKLTNKSSQDTQLIEFIDTIPREFELFEGTNILIFTMRKNQTVVFTYKIRAKEIGIFEFNSFLIRYTDFFGLILNSFYYSLNEEQQIHVLPRFERLESLPIYANYLKYFNGYFISKHFGTDADFRGVREYQTGDKLQHINWKISSRFQSNQVLNLYTNTFDYDSALEFEIMYDVTFESYSVHKESLRIVACLAEFLLRTRNRVGLTIGKEFPERIKSGIGSLQYKIIVEKLLQTATDDQKSTEMVLPRLLNSLAPIHKKTVIFIISPFLNENIRDLTIQLKKKNYSLLVIQPDAIMKQITTEQSDKIISQIGHSFKNFVSLDLLFEKKVTIDDMLEKSIPLLVWNTKQPIKSVFFHRLLKF